MTLVPDNKNCHIFFGLVNLESKTIEIRLNRVIMWTSYDFTTEILPVVVLNDYFPGELVPLSKHSISNKIFCNKEKLITLSDNLSQTNGFELRLIFEEISKNYKSDDRYKDFLIMFYVEDDRLYV